MHASGGVSVQACLPDPQHDQQQTVNYNALQIVQ